MSRQLSKKTLQKVCWRNMFPFQWSWNYETMQGSGYGWVVWPAMKELYGDDPEKMKEMLRAESGYFNTTPAMSHLIVGADLALQEELGTESKDMVMAMKSGLMGPFAGVGDTIFLAIYRAVFFSIASYFALDGVPFGLLIPIITGLFIIFTRYKFTFMGYSQGKKLASEFADRMRFYSGLDGSWRPGGFGSYVLTGSGICGRGGNSFCTELPGHDDAEADSTGNCPVLLLAAGQKENEFY